MIYFKRAAQEYTEPYITVKRGDRKLRTIIHAPVILKYPSTRPQNLKNDKMLNFSMPKTLTDQDRIFENFAFDLQLLVLKFVLKTLLSLSEIEYRNELNFLSVVFSKVFSEHCH